jgi:hypothetical protein
MSDAQALLDQIITERGGQQAFDATALGVARRLANILASDSDGSAAAIAQLCELLPAKPSNTEPPLDAAALGKLTDEQFKLYSQFVAIMTGEEPPTPEPPLPSRSSRQAMADMAAVAVNELEQRYNEAHRAGRPWSLSDADLLLLRNAAHIFFGCMARPIDLYRAEIESAVETQYRNQAQARGLDEDRGGTADAPQVESAPAPATALTVVPKQESATVLYLRSIGRSNTPSLLP